MSLEAWNYILLFVWLAALIPWIYFYGNGLDRVRQQRGTDPFRRSLVRFVCVHTAALVALTLVGPVALLHVYSPWLGKSAALGLVCASPLLALGLVQQAMKAPRPSKA